MLKRADRRRSMSSAKAEESQYLAQYNSHEASIDALDYIGENDASSQQRGSGTPSRTIIALALLLTIIGFTVQVEAIAYYQDVLGWRKPFLSLYLTHSNLCLPWICHLAYLRTQNRQAAPRVWLRRYTDDLIESISSVEAFADGRYFSLPKHGSIAATPAGFLVASMLIVTLVLTLSGLSWFTALAYTTPGDLTAIYNCSAFFAAVFSVPLLKQEIGRTTVIAVAMSIVGTLIIAYGDSGKSGGEGSANNETGAYRLFGNLIAAVGAVAFGLYSVLFKRWTEIQRPNRPSAGFELAVAASGLTGVYTALLGWIGIVMLHIFDIETFALPTLQVSSYLVISIVCGAISMTLLLLLVTWTTPVFGSVTSILSVFFVAIADWLLFGLMPSFATYVGGGLIFVAFGLLARDGSSVSSA